jgi:predicted phage tail protein
LFVGVFSLAAAWFCACFDAGLYAITVFACIGAGMTARGVYLLRADES